MTPGMEFFKTVFPLRLDPSKWGPLPTRLASHDRCVICNQTDQLLYNPGLVEKIRCRVCALLGQSFPAAKNGAGQQTLTRGEFVLLTEDSAVFYSGAGRDFSAFDPGIRVKPSAGIAQEIAAILRDPPAGRWMFFGFERSPSPEKMHVNVGNAVVRLSGLVSVHGVPMIGLIARERLLGIKSQFQLTAKDWMLFQRARYQKEVERHERARQKALKTYLEILSQYPGLSRIKMPLYRSPEAVVLEII